MKRSQQSTEAFSIAEESVIIITKFLWRWNLSRLWIESPCKFKSSSAAFFQHCVTWFTEHVCLSLFFSPCIHALPASSHYINGCLSRFFSRENELSYLSLRACIGLWTAFLCIVLVATDASSLVCYITRFTEEAFASLICIIFIYEAIEKLIHLGETYPVHMHSQLDKLTLY